MAKGKVKKVVLAYSGGLDTSVIVPWLKENYDCEVICFAPTWARARNWTGSRRRRSPPARARSSSRTCARSSSRTTSSPRCRPARSTSATYLLGTSIARPLIAKQLVEVAEAEGADAVAHGCTGKGNDQVRFELTVMALDPKLKVIAPWREWDIRSREEAIAYAKQHNVPVSQTEKDIYSRDSNLWHLSHEGGILEDPWNEPEERMFQLTVSPGEGAGQGRVRRDRFREGRAGRAERRGSPGSRSSPA